MTPKLSLAIITGNSERYIERFLECFTPLADEVVIIRAIGSQTPDETFTRELAAAGAQVFTPQTASLLIGAVAVSMLVSPLILVAIDKLLLPRYANCGAAKPDEISEQQEAPIIIAGFGRFGQIVGRIFDDDRPQRLCCRRLRDSGRAAAVVGPPATSSLPHLQIGWRCRSSRGCSSQD